MAVVWRTVKVVPLRRAGRWVVGAVVQEGGGKRRIKLFKGIVKEKGSVEVEVGGKKHKVSMVQRLNIPSRRYWEWLKREVDSLVKEYLGEKGGDEGETITLEEFV